MDVCSSIITALNKETAQGTTLPTTSSSHHRQKHHKTTTPPSISRYCCFFFLYWNTSSTETFLWQSLATQWQLHTPQRSLASSRTRLVGRGDVTYSEHCRFAFSKAGHGQPPPPPRRRRRWRWTKMGNIFLFFRYRTDLPRKRVVIWAVTISVVVLRQYGPWVKKEVSQGWCGRHHLDASNLMI